MNLVGLCSIGIDERSRGKENDNAFSEKTISLEGAHFYRNIMSNEELFKAKIVHLIVLRKPEEALEYLSKHFSTEVPRLRVGMPKRHGRNAGCYVSRSRTIFVSDQDILYNPYVILHEFYHHLRTQNGKHKGTEKYADKFAQEYLETYRRVIDQI